MKERLVALAARIDALTLRERAIAFAAAVALTVFALYSFSIAPVQEKQRNALVQIAQQQKEMTAISNEIAAMIQGNAKDPNDALRARLERARIDIDKMGSNLRTMQNGMVPAERIAPLLESMMRASGQLKLVGLRTLPVTGLSEQIPGLRVELPKAPEATAPGLPNPLAASPVSLITAAIEKGAAAHAKAELEAARSAELVYRHGVELTVQGSYLDMLKFMAALENMPTQLFWGRAQLDASDHRKARLTLTVFTLSFEQKWMKL